jgi:GDP-4-dehydro-6-deoxy-D-mannose reductase
VSNRSSATEPFLSSDPMEVLVTGAAGFVGQHLVRALLRSGCSVVAGTLEGEPPAVGDGVLDPSERAAVRWVPLDVTDDGSIAALLADATPSWLFHLAGQSSVGSSFQDVLGTWEVNATGTVRLVAAASERFGGAVRLVLVSSGEVYGVVPPAEQPIAEDRPTAPVSPYSAAKLAGEVGALQLARAGRADVVVARSFNHTGPGQSTRFALASWAEQLARIAAGEAEPVLRVGNLEVWRDILDVRDVVAAYLSLAERGGSGGVYNVCSGEAYSLATLARTLIDLSATEAELVVDPSRVRTADIPLLRGDPTRIRELGWSASIPIRQTLQDLFSFMSRSRNDGSE